jgi:hypothetical protein
LIVISLVWNSIGSLVNMLEDWTILVEYLVNKSIY